MRYTRPRTKLAFHKSCELWDKLLFFLQFFYRNTLQSRVTAQRQLSSLEVRQIKDNKSEMSLVFKKKKNHQIEEAQSRL